MNLTSSESSKLLERRISIDAGIQMTQGEPDQENACVSIRFNEKESPWANKAFRRRDDVLAVTDTEAL
jgi:hypothetical protein